MSIKRASREQGRMKYSSISLWQRRLAKLSLVLVCFLLFETYREMVANYASKGINWVQEMKNKSMAGADRDVYTEKLNTIIKNLQILQENNRLNGGMNPAFAKEGRELGGNGQPNDGGANTHPSFSVEGQLEMGVKPRGGPYSPSVCHLGLQPQVDWNHPVVPRFPLNPTKFLFPILKNEPIDQLIGLRQAIMLAIKLNRTLALPYFHNHNYGGNQKYIPPLPAALKINVDILRHFISVIPTDALHEKCNRKFDVALLTGHIDAQPGVSGLLKAQAEGQIQFLNTMNVTVDPNFDVKFSVPAFPRNLKQGEKVSFAPTNPELLKYYPKETNKYRCAVHPFPLSALDVEPFTRKAIKLPNYRVNLDKMKNDIIYSAVWYYTQPPAFVQQLASQVIEDLIHAKQNEGVYNFLCINYHKHKPGDTTGMDLDLATLTAVLKQLLKKSREISNSLQVSGIFIASPRSKQEKAKDYRENIKIMDSGEILPIFSGEDIITMWGDKYFSGDSNSPESVCSLLEDDTQDILSFVEMQVCAEAAIFIRSIGSSWAANVQANRLKNPYSRLDMSMKELVEKFGSTKS